MAIDLYIYHCASSLTCYELALSIKCIFKKTKLIFAAMNAFIIIS